MARCYALAGAKVLCYPSAFGSEPDYPDFGTAPLLRPVVTGHAAANGLFIALPNRFGSEGLLHFYGTSCIIDAFGRVLVEAPRDEATALGTNRAIWLCKGLWRDNFLNGTKGHVDIVACFAPDGCLLIHQQTSQDHPDFALWDTLAEQFREKVLR